uniref:Uncharacterized protein n=1 Tax=Anguilla anguilla TaxID=7936 RepID=A0A0E9VR92_ANGAN
MSTHCCPSAFFNTRSYERGIIKERLE